MFHLTVTYNNERLNAMVTAEISLPRTLTLDQALDEILRHGDELMLDYVDEEDDEEEGTGGTSFTIDDWF